MKKENLVLTSEIFDKRYLSGDFEGRVLAEVQAQKAVRLALQPNQVSKDVIAFLNFVTHCLNDLQQSINQAITLQLINHVLSVLWKPICRELGKQTSSHDHLCFDGNVNRKRKKTEGEETETPEHSSSFKDCWKQLHTQLWNVGAKVSFNFKLVSYFFSFVYIGVLECCTFRIK